MDEMIRTLPMIPLRGLTVLPLMIVNFDISREKSIRAVEAAMEQDQTIFLVTQRDPEENQPGIDGLYHTGTVAKIKNIAKLPKNIVRVMVEGVGRGHLLAMQEGAGYLLGQAEISEEEKTQFDELTKTAMVRALQDLLGRYGQINQKFGKDMMQQLMTISDVETLVAEAGAHLPLFYEERQRILDAENFSDRYDALCTVIANEAEIIQIRNELQQKVKERVDKNQKEYILREQLKVIQQELGEDTLLTDVENYKKQAEALTASDEVKKKIIKE
ncbi:MAG: LON peptidase substrate-binding domain-containing protein, partial [Lachnospiraceae bacterium]